MEGLQNLVEESEVVNNSCEASTHLVDYSIRAFIVAEPGLTMMSALVARFKKHAYIDYKLHRVSNDD